MICGGREHVFCFGQSLFVMCGRKVIEFIYDFCSLWEQLYSKKYSTMEGRFYGFGGRILFAALWVADHYVKV